MNKRRTKRIITKLAPEIEAVLDEIATNEFGYDVTKRRWIVAVALEKGILAMVDWKKQHPLFMGKPFRLVAEATRRFPSVEIVEKVEAEEKSIDAVLEAATKDAEQMVDDDEL